MIWTCDCGAEAIAFRPGTEPEIAPGGFMVTRGEPAEARCWRCFMRAYGPAQADLFSPIAPHRAADQQEKQA